MGTDLIDGELEVIQKYIDSGDVVFDVGAYCGEWSLAVLDNKSEDVYLHCFEPHSISYETLRQNLRKYHNSITLNNLFLSDGRKKTDFWMYPILSLSTGHKRNPEVMAKHRV
ncbi:unnamed protein product, partial [marine sediment metagenome]